MSYTFFGLQVAVKAFEPAGFRSRLHQVVARAPTRQSLQEKRNFWVEVSDLLVGAVPAFERGFWDLVRGDKAETEMETWTSEIEGSLASEREGPGYRAPSPSALEPGPRYALVTCLFLVGADSSSDLTLGERCDLPEDRWWTRQTFARLLRAFPVLNFAQVKSDAVYLAPGHDRDGLPMADLGGEGYEYLRRLT